MIPIVLTTKRYLLHGALGAPSLAPVSIESMDTFEIACVFDQPKKRQREIMYIVNGVEDEERNWRRVFFFRGLLLSFHAGGYGHFIVVEKSSRIFLIIFYFVKFIIFISTIY